MPSDLQLPDPPLAGESPHIEVRGVVKTYADGTKALDGVDLRIEDGMLGLLGPNGAGKSTLLEILVLGLEPSAGEVRWFGSTARGRERASVRSRLGYLSQEYRPPGLLTGLEVLLLSGELRGVPLRRRDLRRRALALLEAVELQQVAHRPSGTYSGGMARRLGLAQALIHAPRALLVDEPTAGLDPEERIRFRLLVTDLAEEIPVLLSTHIVEDIEATCSRLAVLGGGRVRFDGPPGDLLARVAGKIWVRRPEARPEGPESGVLGLGAETAPEGGAVEVLHAAERPEGSRAREATLEDALAVFLGLSLAELEADDAGPGDESSPGSECGADGDDGAGS